MATLVRPSLDHMLPRISIRVKLLAALGLNLALMIVLGAFALDRMATMNDRASLVARSTMPSAANVARINDILSRYRTLQLEYIINTNSADKARIENEMNDMEAAMRIVLQSQRPLINNDEERAAFEQVQDLWDHFTAATHERFIPASRYNNTGTVQPAFSRLSPLYQDLAAAAGQLAAQNQRQASEALGVVQRSYQTGRDFMLLGTLAVLVLAALVGLGLARTLARRLSRLTDATIAVAGGDLERSVDVPSRDELGTLAQNFNQMVASLRRQQAMLEQRNHELQASLQRQQQLTADLIERTRAEEAAERARAAAEAASQAKSMFLATMSHELRTPLNAILGYAQVLHLEAGATGQTAILPELGRIRMAGKHLLGIISNILDFSKIEQGKMELDLSVCNVAGLSRDVIDIITPLAQERGNRLELDCAAALGSIRTDSGKVRQILFNLLSNAAKFTENGYITLTVTADDGANVADGSAPRVAFRISDTGIGMTPAQLGRLFQPFNQADASITRKYGGTGLGMAVSYQLCRMLHGTLTVESEVEKGSTFTLTLPAI